MRPDRLELEEVPMRALTSVRPPASRMATVAVLAVCLLVGAVPSAEAESSNQVFVSHHTFVEPNCAEGVFRASGVVDDSGTARVCAQRGDKAFTVFGTEWMHGRLADYVLRWKVHCDAVEPGVFHCHGQWRLVSPRYLQGGGDVFVEVRQEGSDRTMRRVYTGHLTRV